MTYQRIKPRPELENLVEFFGVQISHEISPAVTKVLPTNHHDLLIHFADPFVHHLGEHTTIEPTAHLCGLRSEPYEVSASGKTGIIVCSFFPWAVHELTGFPMNSLSNATVEARHVFAGIDQIIQSMFSCHDHFEQVRLLENYLIRLTNLRAPDQFLRRASTLMLNNPSETALQLAEELGKSKRQLDRRFLEGVGLTPKTFARVIRFQQALEYRLKPLPAATVAVNCGFHDQAHMNRELKQLGGNTPGKLLTQRDSTPLLTQFNAPLPRVSRFYNTLYL